MFVQGVPDSLDLVPIAAFKGKGKRKGCCLIVSVIIVLFCLCFHALGPNIFELHVHGKKTYQRKVTVEVVMI